MNILYLSADRGIPIRGSKGAAIHIRSICAAFRRLGHTVTLLNPQPGPDGGQEVEARLIHVPMPEFAIPGGEPAAVQEEQAIRYAGVLLESALRELRTGNFDLIYERFSLWSDAGARASETSGVPLVLEVNAPLREESARYRALADDGGARAIEARQFRGAAAVIAVSEAVAAYVTSMGAPPDRVHVLPNGVDPARFHPAAGGGGKVLARYGLQGKHVVGFVGRARPWHDLDTLLRAFGHLHSEDRRYHLLLVGQMPDGIEKRLSELDISPAVTLTGPVPHDEVPAHIAALKVAVSCHAAMEDFYFSPLKLFEYMACARPTVAADLGQPSALIQPGRNGELYPPGDHVALAGRIDALVRKPAYAGALGWRGAVQVLENHTWDRIAALTLSLAGPGPLPPARPEAIFPALPILDPKLKQRLYRATRADLAGELLRKRVPLRKNRTPLAGIEVLKYKPGRRCVLRYTWQEVPGRAPLHVIGKVFKDGRGRRLDEVQRLLSDHGLGGGQFRVPRSYGYVPKMRMQLQEAADGQTLNDLYRARGDISSLVHLCAEGLARLHDISGTLPAAAAGDLERLVGVYTLSDELDSLRPITAALAGFRPHEASLFEDLRRQLSGLGEGLSEEDEPVLVHRDFYYSQVLIDEENRLSIIDLDLLAMGDAAIDVANFSAHLNFLGLEAVGDFHALAGEAAAFKGAYQASRQMPSGFWQRVVFYETATLFRLLRVVAARPQKTAVFEPLLAQVVGALEPA